MKLHLRKYHYTSFETAGSASRAAELARQAQAKAAKDIAEQIVAEVKDEQETRPELQLRFSQADLDAAKEAAFEQGRQAGVAEHEKAVGAKIAADNAQISMLVDNLAAKIEAEAKTTREQNLLLAEKLKAVAFAAAKKVVANLGDLHLAQIEVSVLQAVEKIASDVQPELRVPPEMAEKLSEFIQQKQLNLLVVPSLEVAEHDFQLSWKNGYAERKLNEIWQEIGEVVLGKSPDKFNPSEFALANDADKFNDNNNNEVENG